MKDNWYENGWFKVHILGAAKMVSGYCILIEVMVKGEIYYFMVDCGLFQTRFSAKNYLNDLKFPVDASCIKYLLLTHAHVDHCGRIPKIYKDGFRGKIIATPPTIDLCKLVLPDCAKIQDMEMAQINKKRIRNGIEPLETIYTMEDAHGSCELFEPIQYNEVVRYEDWLSVRYIDAGHMLGSASIVVYLNNGEEEVKLLFSGDLGHKNPILEELSQAYVEADYVFIESTYGGRIHQPMMCNIERFIDAVSSTLKGGGNVIIPAFANGRTQEVTFQLFEASLKYRNDSRCKIISKTPVFIDSPMAVSATEIYRKYINYLNSRVKSYFKLGMNPLDFPNLHLVRDASESMKLNDDKTPKIIESSSGMCEAGRIKHHLKHNLWRPECTLIFVGYQAEGTLGRRLLDGEKKVKIYGEEIAVKSKIEYFQGLSGHADQDKLIYWLKGIHLTNKNVFLMHGEPEQQNELKKRIEKEMPNVKVTIPILRSAYVFNKYGFTQYQDNTSNTDITKAYPALCVLAQLHELNDSIADFKANMDRTLREGINEFEQDYIIDKIKIVNDYLKSFKY